MSGTSKISASGNAKLKLPSDFGGKIYAKGSTVTVRHIVEGTETDTLVQGTVGEGKAQVRVTARGSVDVQTSN